MVDVNAIGQNSVGASSARATAVWDDFDRSSRLLDDDIAPTGQVWDISGQGAATVTIANGQMTSPGGNCYAYLDYGQTVGEARAAFSFGSSFTSTQMVWTLIADVSPSSGGLQTMLHMNFGTKGYSFTKRKAGGSFDPPTSGAYQGTWDLRPDCLYLVGMAIDHTAGTVTLSLPDGTFAVLTDTDFVSNIVPRYVALQLTASATTACRWDAISIGPNVAEKLAGLGRAIPLGEMPGLKGSGILRPQRASLLLSGAAGYYRILTEATRSTYLLVGSLALDAYDSSYLYASSRKCEFRAVNGDAAGILISQQGVGYGRNSPITKARISQLDTTPFGKVLDLYKAVAPDITVDLEFRGYGVLATTAPAVGATALATANAEVTFN